MGDLIGYSIHATGFMPIAHDIEEIISNSKTTKTMNPVTANILQTFEQYRMTPTAIDQYEQVGKSILANRIDDFVSNKQPIKFAMLGFPFKSTNTRDKVLGPLPDLGEQLTIQNFENFNKNVKQVYAPGVHIRIASDGTYV